MLLVRPPAAAGIVDQVDMRACKFVQQVAESSLIADQHRKVVDDDGGWILGKVIMGGAERVRGHFCELFVNSLDIRRVVDPDDLGEFIRVD